MNTTPLRLGLLFLCAAPVLMAGAFAIDQPGAGREPTQSGTAEKALNLHYLEIVTPKVDETCSALAKAHGVTFSEPVAELGNARTAKLKDGGRIGVRAPMGEEKPVVRPYVLVDDIHAAVKAAEAAGAEVLLPPTEAPGRGTFAIYYIGTIEHGLWQDLEKPPASAPR